MHWSPGFSKSLCWLTIPKRNTPIPEQGSPTRSLSRVMMNYGNVIGVLTLCLSSYLPCSKYRSMSRLD